MGSSWIQVDEKHELVLREGCAKLNNWPSSTKPELIAIWLALFTIPQSSISRFIQIVQRQLLVLTKLKVNGDLIEYSRKKTGTL